MLTLLSLKDNKLSMKGKDILLSLQALEEKKPIKGDIALILHQLNLIDLKLEYVDPLQLIDFNYIERKKGAELVQKTIRNCRYFQEADIREVFELLRKIDFVSHRYAHYLEMTKNKLLKAKKTSSMSAYKTAMLFILYQIEAISERRLRKCFDIINHPTIVPDEVYLKIPEVYFRSYFNSRELKKKTLSEVFLGKDFYENTLSSNKLYIYSISRKFRLDCLDLEELKRKLKIEGDIVDYVLKAYNVPAHIVVSSMIILGGYKSFPFKREAAASIAFILADCCYNFIPFLEMHFAEIMKKAKEKINS